LTCQNVHFKNLQQYNCTMRFNQDTMKLLCIARPVIRGLMGESRILIKPKSQLFDSRTICFLLQSREDKRLKPHKNPALFPKYQIAKSTYVTFSNASTKVLVSHTAITLTASGHFRKRPDAAGYLSFGIPRSHSSFSDGTGKASSGRSTVGLIKQGCLYLLVATGAIVWSMQLVEWFAAWLMPEEYASIMGLDSEDEEDRRSQRFYSVPSHLDDESYLVELSARHEALQEMLTRLETNQAMLSALGVSQTRAVDDINPKPVSARPISEHSGLEIVYLSDTSRLLQAGADVSPPSSDVWRPRIYLEGPSSAALATVTFERASPPAPARARRRAGDDPARGWVPVALRVTAVSEGPPDSGRLLIDTRAPLPHGIRYSVLRAKDEDGA
jgi:hypothetical protein